MIRTTAPVLAASVLVVALACAGCGQPPGAPSDPAAGAMDVPGPLPVAAPATAPRDDHDVRSGVPRAIELPPADAATPALPAGADVVYACEDGGDLRVTYASGMANVTLPDGAIVALPRAPQASAAAGGEVYLGDLLGLRRIGNVVEVQQQAGETRRCREDAASA